MLACAILPFLPLIEDAMICQLGDPNPAKHEAAMRFLDKMLRDSNGLRDYGAFRKIVDARGKGPPKAREWCCHLYWEHKDRYFLEYPYVVVVLSNGVTGGLTDPK